MDTKEDTSSCACPYSQLLLYELAQLQLELCRFSSNNSGDVIALTAAMASRIRKFARHSDGCEFCQKEPLLKATFEEFERVMSKPTGKAVAKPASDPNAPLEHHRLPIN